MMNPLVTIIVPVYNTSQYLQRCLDSLIGQTYRNIEIILVDDGSTDNSPHLCDTYAAESTKVRVIHKENGGQSSSRNRGLDEAIGEWIAFVDSDDWIARDTMECCIYYSKKDQTLDIIQYGIAEVYSFEETAVVSENRAFLKKYDSLEIRRTMLSESIKDDAWFSCCRCLFKKSTIGDLRFREGKINEDIDFKYYVFRNANYVLDINCVKYYYYQATGSTTTSPLKIRDFDLYDAVAELVKQVKADGDLELCEYARNRQAKVPLSLLCKAAYYGMSDEIKEKEKTLNKLTKQLKRDLKRILRSGVKPSRKILAISFLVSFKFTKLWVQIAKKYLHL